MPGPYGTIDEVIVEAKGTTFDALWHESIDPPEPPTPRAA